MKQRRFEVDGQIITTPAEMYVYEPGKENKPVSLGVVEKEYEIKKEAELYGETFGYDKVLFSFRELTKAEYNEVRNKAYNELFSALFNRPSNKIIRDLKLFKN